MVKNLLTVIGILISLNALSQDSTAHSPYISDVVKERSLLIGFNQGAYTFAEIGYAFNKYGAAGHHSFATAFYGSTEIMVGRDFMLGPKLGFHTMGGAGGIALGGCAIYYTNFKEGNFVLRPEFGVGIERFKIVYGYNIKFKDKDSDRFNRHLISFACLITVKTMK
jgi:hypothetical protein